MTAKPARTAPPLDTFLDVGAADPRFAFMDALIGLAETDERIVALDADVSRRTLTRHFRDRFPDRFWDLGVAEQNLMGVAAGLAAAGRLPVAFTFAVFVSMRALEPIRTSICYPRLPVRLVGGYAGLSNGKDGATHQSIEDVAIMRALPNLVVISPSDAALGAAMARAAMAHDGPVYIRIEYEETPAIHPPGVDFRIGRGLRVRAGSDVTLAAYGLAVARVLEAARALAGQGIDAEVLDMASLKPFDAELLLASVDRTGALVTLEDHSLIGGLASAAADVLVRAGRSPRLATLGIADRFSESGRNAELRTLLGLDADAVVAAARSLVEASGPVTLSGGAAAGGDPAGGARR
jgi:transketolase